MVTRSLALVDHSSGVSARDLQKFCSALDRQLAEEVAPVWGRYVTPFVAKAGAQLDPKTWVLHVWDNVRSAKDAGALGFHETEGADHVPVGHVFTELAKREGSAWTTIADHEALEMVGDEWINLEVARVKSGSVELWPREICDAVQGLTYERNGVVLSDFVLPEYFIDGSDGPYDFMRRLPAPFAIDPTGYSSIRIIKDGRVRGKDIYGARYAVSRRDMRALSRKASRFRW